MPRKHKFIRYRFLLDEGLPARTYFPRTNARHDLKHITHDLKKMGLSDQAIHGVAEQGKRLILTFNVRHFRDLAVHSKKTGVIGVSQNLSNEMVDKKLLSLLTRKTKGELYGKFTMITGETK